jgi:UDP-3-O-[3-hydroxymyristoyl] glucosamine N-acyltransferase
LRSEHPRLAFARIRTLLARQSFEASGVSPLASIEPGCRISPRVSIHPFVRIGRSTIVEDEVTIYSGVVIGENCRIGPGTTIFPNVTIYSDSRLGSQVRIHAGTVIGADGFGYIFDGTGQYKVPQSGSVEIGDDVEIGANSCVDRGTFGATVLETGVKLDNHVHVGHNSRIGAHTVVVGCVGISGSVTIGKRCVLAGQCGVSDHVTIGDDVTVMSKTAVVKDVPSGTRVSGFYGRNHREQLRVEALLRRLPELARDLKSIKRLLSAEGLWTEKEGQ